MRWETVSENIILYTCYICSPMFTTHFTGKYFSWLRFISHRSSLLLQIYAEKVGYKDNLFHAVQFFHAYRKSLVVRCHVWNVAYNNLYFLCLILSKYCRISLCISIYLMIGVGIERFIAVCRPHHFRQVQTDNYRSVLLETRKSFK